MRHPVHPMLVHAPLACWTLAPLCDAAALIEGSAFFWRVSSLLAAAGLVLGLAAATAGAMDYGRAHECAPRLVLLHALLMGSAWTASAASLVGRLGPTYQVLTPPPAWAIAAGLLTLALSLAGGWCGGEMVYGRGIGVRAGGSGQ